MRIVQVRAEVPVVGAWTDKQVRQVFGELPGFGLYVSGRLLTFVFEVNVPGTRGSRVNSQPAIEKGHEMLRDAAVAAGKGLTGSRVTVEKVFD